ncbi:ABC transporter substrate-binding protein [Nocardia puris]|uniref:Nitrate/nitrite transport system substrate-binding protein n=1 Tax=Nocardia puris TaxID=208602 RepID=A0A366DHJ1_9NOCA|nr:ABC transporter substrate-binding protein [Nocardia puris]RBO89557.1 nitrate/nitrite transport system substrate-binding protein [Nocardia puris]
MPGPLPRRRFLGIGAAVAGAYATAACAPIAPPPPAAAPASGTTVPGVALEPLPGIEKPKITVGFIPITCSSPIVNAKALGIYAKHGLDVTLKKFSGWAEVWAAYATGEIDATHMLAPMPLAIDQGLASGRMRTRLPLITNTNGQAITLHRKHFGRVRGPEDFAGMRLGVPFDYSVHNLLIRDYLSRGGLDPDTDVELRVLRPPDMVANLMTGGVDGYLGPDPFNQRAVATGAGYLFTLTRDLWAGHPCCGFGVNDEFAQANPVTYQALTRAVHDAALWSDKAENRAAAARSMAPEQFLNQQPQLLEAILTGEFQDGTGIARRVPDRVRFEPYPQEAFGIWMLTQFQRWGLAGAGRWTTAQEYRDTVRSVFDADASRAAFTALGVPPPAPATELLINGRRFDPDHPSHWTVKQVSTT